MKSIEVCVDRPRGGISYLIAAQLTTLALYYLGPITYGGEPPSWVVAVVVLACLASLHWGYRSRRDCCRSLPFRSPNLSSFVIYSAVVSLVLLVPTVMARSGVSAGADLGEIYENSLERTSAGGGFVEYIRMLVGYFTFALLPTVLIFWRSISLAARCLGSVALLGSVAVGVVSGVNKPIFDSIALSAALALTGVWRPKLNPLLRVGSVVVVSLALVAAATYFTEGQISRPGSPAVGGYDPATEMTSEYSLQDGKPLVFYSAASSYFVQGYRALDLALREDPVFTFGVGNSTFWARQVDRLLGSSISDSTYPAKIERYGWDRYINWSSFYVWWASDLSFFGLPVLMYLIGCAVALLRNSAVAERSIFSLVLLSYFLVGLLYLSANNQVMQSGETAVPFVFSLCVWLLFGETRRIVWRRRDV